MSRIYVGNLSRETTEASLREFLSRNGRTVTWIAIKKDAATGIPRGFAFADMSTPEEAAAAIAEQNGTELDGKMVKVSNAIAEKQRGVRESTGYGSSYGGGFGGGGGGGGRFGGRGRR